MTSVHHMLIEEMCTDEWIEHKQPEGSPLAVWETPPERDGRTWKVWLSHEGQGTAQYGKTHGDLPELVAWRMWFQWFGAVTLEGLAEKRDQCIAAFHEEPPECNLCGRAMGSIGADGMCAECAR